MKRKLAIYLGVGLMSISLVACNSQPTENKDTDNAITTSQDEEQAIAGESLLQWGKIVSIDKENGSILIENKDVPTEGENADLNQVVLTTSSDKTAFINAETGEKVSFDDLKEGDDIYAWVSIAFTRSLPPQTFAYAIATNISGTTSPTYIGVASVEKTDAGLFLTDKTDMKWDLTNVESKNITAYADGKEIDPTTIKADSTCLIWPETIPVSEDAGNTTLKAIRVIVLN